MQARDLYPNDSDRTVDLPMCSSQNAQGRYLCIGIGEYWKYPSCYLPDVLRSSTPKVGTKLLTSLCAPQKTLSLVTKLLILICVAHMAIFKNHWNFFFYFMSLYELPIPFHLYTVDLIKLFLFVLFFTCCAKLTIFIQECPAIDYTRHTLDGAACLLNSNKYFPSR